MAPSPTPGPSNSSTSYPTAATTDRLIFLQQETAGIWFYSPSLGGTHADPARRTGRSGSASTVCLKKERAGLNGRSGPEQLAKRTFLIVEPISCVSAPSLNKESGGFLGLEELPFADAEWVADSNHLLRIDERIKIRGNNTREFPTSPEALKNAVGNLAHETSPYEHGGKQLDFDLEFVLDKGVPYSANPERPGIVYYSVNPSGTQFALTISGLNAPVSDRASMMKEGTFVGSKQPWGGLLATEDSLFQR